MQTEDRTDAIPKEAETRPPASGGDRNGPNFKRGWGKDSDLLPGDLLLILQSVREGWNTPKPVCDAIIREVVVAALDAQKPRLTLAAVRCAIDMVKDNRGGFDAWRRRRAKG